MDELTKRRLLTTVVAYKEQLARANHQLIAILPASSDVVSLEAWAHERGMPECADEARFFLNIGLLRLSVHGGDPDTIRRFIGKVITSPSENIEIIADGIPEAAARDAALMVGLAVSIMLAHQCDALLVAEYASRYVALMDTPQLSS